MNIGLRVNQLVAQLTDQVDVATGRQFRTADFAPGFVELDQHLECLPLDTATYRLAVQRLRNALQYIQEQALGAARIELNLLMGLLNESDRAFEPHRRGAASPTEINWIEADASRISPAPGANNN